MRLRHISIFFIVGIALINLLASCNDSETESISSTLSADSQIYSFSATYIPRTHNDSVLFRPALVKAKFAIDQSTRTIYNVDSLPYGFDVRKIAASITFSSSTPSATQVVYKDISANDSLVDWSSATDSIDFMIFPKRNASLNGVPQVEFKVTPQNGTVPPLYTIKLLIHQVDPDSIIWTKKADLPSTSVPAKALSINNECYYFAASGSNLSVYKTTDGGSWTAVGNATTFPAAIRIESVSLLGTDLFVTDINKNVYQSADLGATWNTTPVASNIINIVGQLYDTSAKAYKLVALVDDAGVTKLALTTDFTALTNQVVVDGFPVSAYQSLYDSKYNRLLVTGGQKAGSVDYQNTTWWVTFANDNIEVINNNKPLLIPFVGNSGLATFLYDNKLYAWAKDKEAGVGFKLYKSDAGMNWVKAEQKQYFHKNAEAASGQCILVDADGYIWSLGGTTGLSQPTKEVWRGMMTKMGFK